MAGCVINSKIAALFLGCFLLSKTEPALAHLVTTGMGPVYDGIGHFFLTVEDVLLVFVASLYSGLCGRRWSRVAVFILPIAWFVGGLLGSFMSTLPALPYAIFGFLLFGILTASDFKLPISLFAGLISLFGLVHGLYNGVAMQAGPGISGLLGISGAIFVLAPILSALVVTITPAWCRIVFRVGGSWVAASGLLLIGWYFKQHQ